MPRTPSAGAMSAKAGKNDRRRSPGKVPERGITLESCSDEGGADFMKYENITRAVFLKCHVEPDSLEIID